MKKDALTNKLIENIINICKKLRLTPEKLTRDKFREAAKKFELSNHYEGNYTVAKNAASKIFNNKAKIDKLVQNNIVQEKISDEANEKKETEEKNRVVEILFKFVKEHGFLPTIVQFNKIKNVNNKLFKSMEELESSLFILHPEAKNYLLNESIYDEDYKNLVEEEIKKHKKFVITTAVSGKPVDYKFFNSIKNYAQRNNALVLILPSEDVSSRKRKSEYKWNLDARLSEFMIVFKDVYLNKNLCLSTIKTSAKQINPLTGLDRLTQKLDASIILASTKYFLKFIPTLKGKYPKALMTTGAITVGDYDTDYYMSKRLSVIAENDHRLGAIVVDVEDSHIYHFRQLTASRTKSITDLGVKYTPDYSIVTNTNPILVLGDSHVGMNNKKLLPYIIKTIKDLEVKEVVIHDAFNMTYGNHHEDGKICIQARKFLNGKSEIYKEGVQLAEYLDTLADYVEQVTVVKSNHDMQLNRYLEEGKFVNDPINFYTALDLAKKVVENSDPLEYLITEKIGLKNRNKIKWLKLDESYNLYGNELGNHGHLGANGGRGNSKTFENAFGSCIVGHSHTAGIFRDVMTVGITSEMDLGYNVGLSSWTYSCAILYNTGTKQLINYIKRNKEYKYLSE